MQTPVVTQMADTSVPMDIDQNKCKLETCTCYNCNEKGHLHNTAQNLRSSRFSWLSQPRLIIRVWYNTPFWHIFGTFFCSWVGNYIPAPIPITTHTHDLHVFCMLRIQVSVQILIFSIYSSYFSFMWAFATNQSLLWLHIFTGVWLCDLSSFPETEVRVCVYFIVSFSS